MGTPVARALSRTHSAPGARSRSRSVITASHSCARGQKTLAFKPWVKLHSIAFSTIDTHQEVLHRIAWWKSLESKAEPKP